MKNRILTSTLMISGTAIGAGMLALPVAIYLTGFAYGILLLLLICWLANYGGLLIARACKHYPSADSLHGLVDKFLNKTGQHISLIFTLFLYWSLCAAYISGISEKIANSLQIADGIATYSIPFILTILMSTCLVIGTKFIAEFNRIAFFIMIGCLGIIIAILIPKVTLQNININHNTDFLMTLGILPLLFTSFGYHIVIPSIARYLNHKSTRINRALVFGSTIPGILYVIWTIVVIGVIQDKRLDELSHAPQSVQFLNYEISSIVNNIFFETANTGFYILAMLTSFFGVSLGLSDYLAEVFEQENTIKGRINKALLTLLFPLIISLFIPGFVKALGLAAIALVVLAVFIPVVITVKINKMKQLGYKTYDQVFLPVAVILGIVIIVAQLGIITNIVPNIS